ncbi:MAG: GGDEF domain-containing protein [Smithella sp.]|jgi:diguanylate cyclase (GGDEF)-like protein
MKAAELNTLQQLLNDSGWRLRFNEELELEFQQDYARRYYLHMQVAGIMGVIAFMACGILDLIWMPEMAGRTWFIRMVAGVPMWGPLLLSFWGKFRQKFGERYMQLSTCIFAISAVVGLIAISLNSIEPYNYYYYNAITVALVIIFVLSRIQFRWGVISAIIMWLSLNAGLIVFGPASNKLAIVIITNYVFIGSAVSALIGTFLIERSLRQNYLQSRMISLENRDLEESNLKLQYLSAIDGLTQIANRRSLDRILTIEWQRALRKREPIGFIMADIDHFKVFNDTYGHQAGDECLRVVASLLKDYARRPGDLAARYGGEEFALVLTDSSAEQAGIIAEQMRDKIMNVVIKYKKNDPTHVTASFGVASMVPGSGHASPEALILAADQAMYQAKRSGRNRVVIYGHPDVDQKEQHTQQEIDR